MGALAYHLKDPLKSIHMPLGFVAMGQKGRFQLLRFRGLRQLRQGLQDLPLGEINVLQSIIKQIVQGFIDHDILQFHQN